RHTNRWDSGSFRQRSISGSCDLVARPCAAFASRGARRLGIVPATTLGREPLLRLSSLRHRRRIGGAPRRMAARTRSEVPPPLGSSTRAGYVAYADLEPHNMPSPYQSPTKRLAVEVLIDDGSRLVGDVYLHPNTMAPGGYESPLTMIDDHAWFYPVSEEGGAVALVGKRRTVSLSYASPGDAAVPESTAATD